MAYAVDLAQAVGDGDRVIAQHGATVIVDSMAALFLTGVEIDYVDDKLRSGFVFRNPNEIARCGCGESFAV
jgi:iron-sulfur cluster assembly protein